MSTPGYEKVKDFAKIAGVSRKSAYLAGQKGTIIIKDGLVDLSDPKTIKYIQSVQIKREAIATAEAGAIEAKEDALKYLPEEAREAGSNGDGTSEKRKLEQSKLEKQNRDLDLKYAKERNELLSRDSVAQVFSKLYSIQVTKLHGFSHMVTPDLAVVFECTDNEKMIQTTELINNAMFTVLEEVKKAMNDFLESVDGEEIYE